jgi:REP element-mobilizing transposase RayT
MDRGHNRQIIFLDDEDRAAFANLLGRYRQAFGFRLVHYCFLSNHFHLLVQLPDPRLWSRLMAGLLRAYAGVLLYVHLRNDQDPARRKRVIHYEANQVTIAISPQNKKQ